MVMQSETFHHQGRTWRRTVARPAEQYVVGLDIGQSHDPSALCVLHYTREPLDKFDVNKEAGTIKQQAVERFDIRHAERLPLGLAYPEQVQHVAALMARPPLRGVAELLVDESGVGRAVGDIFDTAGLDPTRVVITAGDRATNPSHNRWHVPKQLLISTLDARLHTGELRFAAELTEAGALAEELKDFRRKVSTAGRYQYEARVGRHDDLVLAVAIALWSVHRPRGGVSSGYVQGILY